MSFDGKVAIVTGAGRGIGKAGAQVIAERGASTVCADRDGDAARTTAEELVARGFVARGVQCDVGDEQDVDRVVTGAVGEFGRLDLLFANAAMHGFGNVVETEPAFWDEMFRVNLRGVYLCLRRSIPEMIKVGGGAIVATSSDCAVRTSPVAAAYTAAKAGILPLIRTAAVDFGAQGIRANVVTPGVTDTPGLREAYSTGDRTPETGIAKAAGLSPLQRIAKPDDLARAVAFLLSDEAAFITGANLMVDGGMTVTYAAD